MIKIGRTHTVFPCAALDPKSDRDSMIRSEVLATEAVKRLVKAILHARKNMTGHYVSAEDIMLLDAAIAPFTDTEEADNG